MKIEREVNGTMMVFELTDDELYEAYKEKEFMFDVQDIEDVVCGWSDEEFEDSYGIPKEVFDSLVHQMAYQKRRNQDKYDMSWDYARDDAIRTVVAEYKAGKFS